MFAMFRYRKQTDKQIHGFSFLIEVHNFWCACDEKGMTTLPFVETVFIQYAYIQQRALFFSDASRFVEELRRKFVFQTDIVWCLSREVGPQP